MNSRKTDAFLLKKERNGGRQIQVLRNCVERFLNIVSAKLEVFVGTYIGASYLNFAEVVIRTCGAPIGPPLTRELECT